MPKSFTSLGHATATFKNDAARAGYWLGVYAMRRYQWMNIARDNKRAGISPVGAVKTARDYNHQIVEETKRLRNLDALYA